MRQVVWQNLRRKVLMTFDKLSYHRYHGALYLLLLIFKT